MRETREELRWLGDCLGQVRDIDVLADALADSGRELGEDGMAVTVLLDDLEAARAASFAELRASISSPKYLSLMTALCEAAESPPFGKVAFRTASLIVPRLVSRPWRRLRDAVDGLGDLPSDSALHAVRIKAKALRYACEAVRDVAPPAAARLGKRAKALQSVLGEHHDAVALRSFLRQNASRSRQHAYAAGLCLALSLDSDDRDRWRRDWSRLDRPKLTSWLN